MDQWTQTQLDEERSAKSDKFPSPLLWVMAPLPVFQGCNIIILLVGDFWRNNNKCWVWVVDFFLSLDAGC